MTTHLTKNAIQAAITEVNIISEIFFTVAFTCEHVHHKHQVKETSSGIYYSHCSHPKSIENIARCKPDLCPFGKEEN